MAQEHAAGYGGNTPCVEVEAGQRTILIDAGTGIRAAGKSLITRGVEQIDILLSHTHWDHIQGFPYFEPLDLPDVSIRVHGLRQADPTLAEIFAGQQQEPFSQLSLDRVKAQLEFVEHEDGESFRIGDSEVTCRRLNHPGVAAGFRVVSGQRTFAYICDTDLEGDILHADGLPASDGEGPWLQQLKQNACDLGHSADLLVCDTFFLPEEYDPSWGHSCPDEFLRLAADVGAKGIWLFHHRPGRADYDLDRILDRYRPAAIAQGLDLQVAREGLEVAL